MTEATTDAVPPSERLTQHQALEKAVSLHQSGQFKASVPYYVYAVRTEVAEAKAGKRRVDGRILHASGVALAMAGHRTEAIQFLEEALQNGRAKSGSCWSALALAYVETKNLGRAERCYQRAVNLDPTCAANWIGFANLAFAGGSPKVGERRYDRGLASPARDAEEVIAQGMTYLRRGHWRKGWLGYEARSKTAMWAERNPHAMMVKTAMPDKQYDYWHQPPNGSRILVLTEQGQGDTVQFARYLPWLLLHSHASQIVLEPPDALIDMLTGAFQGEPRITVRERSKGAPADVDGWCLLLSIPAILREAKWHHVPPPVRPFGLTWDTANVVPGRVFVHEKGNIAFGNDWDRSAPTDMLARAVRNAGYDVVTAGFSRTGLLTDGGTITADPTWQDTVNLLMTCERVVTVDTGLAHVAGSLGVPMELCLPTVPEWRWSQPDALKTPWYPTARLWHRKRVEAWDEMAGRLQTTLTNLSQAREGADVAPVA